MAADDLSREEMLDFVAAEKKRKDLQRQIDAIERENKPTKEKMKAYVEKNGGIDRTCVHYGFVLQLMPRAGTVKWKDEFVNVAGAKAATDLQNKAAPIFLLSVEPAAAS